LGHARRRLPRSGHRADFSVYYREPEQVSWDADYGTGQTAGGFHHFTKRVFTLESVSDLAAIEAYPWPDFTAPERHAHLEADVARHHAQGYHVSGFVGHIWETGWQILGLERTLADLVLDPEVPAYVLGRICEANCFKAKRYAEAGVDMIRCGDDVGTQHSLMMSPDLWRRTLKPLLAAEIAAARDVVPDIPVWYHSDGDISTILEDLLEVGVTVMNPVQPESRTSATRGRVGRAVRVLGHDRHPDTMPWGTPDDVKKRSDNRSSCLRPADPRPDPRSRTRGAVGEHRRLPRGDRRIRCVRALRGADRAARSSGQERPWPALRQP